MKPLWDWLWGLLLREWETYWGFYLCGALLGAAAVAAAWALTRE